MRTRLGTALLAGCLLSGPGEVAGFSTEQSSTCPTEPIIHWDWGPVAARWRDPEGIERLRVLGPLFERAWDAEGRRFIAVRPFYARSDAPRPKWVRVETLWPLARHKRLGGEVSGRVLLTWYHDADVTDPASAWRVWALPVYFQGRDTEGRPYVAVFPLGGRIRDFLWVEQTDFVLFPLWVRSKKGAVRSTTWMWPVLSETRGKGIYRFRVFPFYGRSVMRDRYQKKFILWPLYLEGRYYHPKASGHVQFILPFYGQSRLTHERTNWWLPPFIRYTRSERQNLIYAPWPLLQVGWGETERFHLWPFWGRMRRPGLETGYAPWPILWWERSERPRALFERRMILPLLVTEREIASGEGGPPEIRMRYVRVWPFFAHERRGTGSHTRAPVLLPLREPPPLDRNWAPWWTLFSRNVTEAGSETEVLWGLFRRQCRASGGVYTSLFPLADWQVERLKGVGAPRRSWSLLKGFLALDSQPDRVRLRMLYWFDLSWSTGTREP